MCVCVCLCVSTCAGRTWRRCSRCVCVCVCVCAYYVGVGGGFVCACNAGGPARTGEEIQGECVGWIQLDVFSLTPQLPHHTRNEPSNQPTTILPFSEPTNQPPFYHVDGVVRRTNEPTTIPPRGVVRRASCFMLHAGRVLAGGEDRRGALPPLRPGGLGHSRRRRGRCACLCACGVMGCCVVDWAHPTQPATGGGEGGALVCVLVLWAGRCVVFGHGRLAGCWPGFARVGRHTHCCCVGLC